MTAAPTPAPMPTFAPVASPWLMREPWETATMVAIGELVVEEAEDEMADEMADEVAKGVGVYQCVDVRNVTTVLSLLIKITTAVLVDSTPDVDETIVNVEPWTEVVIAVEAGAGAEYADDVTAVDEAIMLDVDSVVDDNEGPPDPLDEVMELEVAAQATFRANCMPLLAQVESNVAAAAVHSLATEQSGIEPGGLTLLIVTAAI
jgi:hypothetical protein